VRSKHFAHAVGASCSSETYLHRLAKACFAEGFRLLREEGRAWRVMYHAKACCPVSYPSCPDGEWPVNLARFDQLQIEAPIQGCIADVLLTQSSTGSQLAVEIWVTHACEQAKLAKGFPILEVKIADEASALSLASGTFSEHPWRVLNFPTRRSVKPFSCSACCGVDLFVVHRSGKPVLIAGYHGEPLAGTPVFQRSMGRPAHSEEVSGRRFFEGVCSALEAEVKVVWRPPNRRVMANLRRWLSGLPAPLREKRRQQLESNLHIHIPALSDDPPSSSEARALRR
jgi:hypothetical protein